MKNMARGILMQEHKEFEAGRKAVAKKEQRSSGKDPRYPKTADIRALLSDLKLRPPSHRDFLAKLLRSAAAHSGRKAFVARHAAPTHHVEP
jgi:hypothetical protein